MKRFRRARSHTRRRGRISLFLALAVTAALVVGVAPRYVGAQSSPDADGMEFYEPPSSPPSGAHGDLVRSRPTTVDLGPGAPEVQAWNVMYQSTDATDTPNYVTGTVLVPTAPANGTRPVVTYAPGTHGLAQRCAPSLQMAAGTDYENANLVAALNAGYAVVATDYAGYTTGSTPSYVVGASEGRAVLDIVRAASQVPDSGVSADAPTAVWGYSQGGQSASWAGELQPSYTPDMNLVGVAAGGIPADLPATARYLDGSAGAAFVIMTIVGLAEQYPELPLDAILTPEGRTAIEKLKTQCIFEALPELHNKTVADFTVNRTSLDQLLEIPLVADIVNAQKAGTKPIEAPVYAYHGQADEFIPLDQAYATKLDYCDLGVSVTWDLYSSEHITTQFQGAERALTFLADRFAGTPASDNCDQTTPPESTAPPKGGDFVFPLDEWVLTGDLHLSTLNDDVQLPEGSTFTADANMTTNVLSGDLAIPEFDNPVNVFGFLPVTARIALEPAGTSGTVSYDADGQLHIEGSAKTTIVVKQLTLNELPLLTAECRTVEPVSWPLSFNGPLSHLGTGQVRFEGSGTIPELTGCEGDFIGTFIGPLLSGPNNTFTYTVTPEAPVPA